MSALWWREWWRTPPRLMCRSGLHCSVNFFSPCSRRTSSEVSVLCCRLGCCMRREWGKLTAVTPARGPFLCTAAPGSKHVMQPATLRGESGFCSGLYLQQFCQGYKHIWYAFVDSSVIEEWGHCSVVVVPVCLIVCLPAVLPWILIFWATYTSCFPRGLISSAQWSSTRCVQVCLLLFGFKELLLTHSFFVPPGLCHDRNYQNQFEDVPGVCPPAHFWPLWAAADPGWLSLPADVPLALCLRWEPCALPVGWDSGELCPPLPGSCTNGAERDWSNLWTRLKFKPQHREE